MAKNKKPKVKNSAKDFDQENPNEGFTEIEETGDDENFDDENDFDDQKNVDDFGDEEEENVDEKKEKKTVSKKGPPRNVAPKYRKFE